MKTTKFLIGALAVVSFTACQNDEILTENQAIKPQDREKIDVKIVPVGDADSRMINNNGSFTWETTDQLGASMVDVDLMGTLQDDEHFGNALFSYADGEFTTASTLTVGAYTFYYPYNAANTTTRGGVIVKPLGVQKFDATGEEMMKNNFMVAPIAQLGGAEAGELTLPMTFRSVYGYGTLTLTNNSKDGNLDPQTLEIQKIIIEETANDFVIGGKLAPATVKTAHEDLYVDLRPANADANELFTTADNVYLDWDRNEDGDVNDAVDKATPVQWVKNYDAADEGVVSISCLTGSKGIEVKPGESITTRVLIPAGTYDKANIKITVYTNKGYVELTDAEITTADATGQFIVRNSRVKTIGANIAENPTPLTGVVDIVDKNDFVATMKQFQNQVGGNVSVRMLGNTIVDADMLSVIPAKIESFTFVDDVTIEANTTLSKIKFADGVATFKGNVTIAGNTVFNEEVDLDVNTKSQIVVASGSLTLGKDIAAKTIEVKKDATLNLNSGVAYTGDFANFAGTLNVGVANGAAASITSTSEILLLSGTVNVNAQLNVNNNIKFGSNDENALALTLNASKIINASNVYIYKSTTLNNNAVGFAVRNNTGTIVNNSGLTISATNSGSVTNNAGKTLAVNENAGTIDNYGTATVTTNNGTAIVKAVINQKAETSLLVVTTNDTNGKIVTVAGSTTTVNDTQDGEVVYVENALLAINDPNAEGDVVYEAANLTADQFAGLKPIVNKVVITEDYTMAAIDKNVPFVIPANIKTITFEGDATFNRPVNDDKSNSTVHAFEFYGNVNFVLGAELINGASMTFDGGKTLKGKLIKTGKDKTDTEPATNVALNWTINNGYMKNYCPVDASDDAFTVTFGAANVNYGILAGSIWNDPTTCKSKTFVASPAESWLGQTVATGILSGI